MKGTLLTGFLVALNSAEKSGGKSYHEHVELQ